MAWYLTERFAICSIGRREDWAFRAALNEQSRHLEVAGRSMVIIRREFIACLVWLGVEENLEVLFCGGVSILKLASNKISKVEPRGHVLSR